MANAEKLNELSDSIRGTVNLNEASEG